MLKINFINIVIKCTSKFNKSCRFQHLINFQPYFYVSYLTRDFLTVCCSSYKCLHTYACIHISVCVYVYVYIYVKRFVPSVNYCCFCCLCACLFVGRLNVCLRVRLLSVAVASCCPHAPMPYGGACFMTVH